MFSYEFNKLSKNTFFSEHLWATASEPRESSKLVKYLHDFNTCEIKFYMPRDKYKNIRWEYLQNIIIFN